jgi:hypothetical protein
MLMTALCGTPMMTGAANAADLSVPYPPSAPIAAAPWPPLTETITDQTAMLGLAWRR